MAREEKSNPNKIFEDVKIKLLKKKIKGKTLTNLVGGLVSNPREVLNLARNQEENDQIYGKAEINLGEEGFEVNLYLFKRGVKKRVIKNVMKSFGDYLVNGGSIEKKEVSYVEEEPKTYFEHIKGVSKY